MSWELGLSIVALVIALASAWYARAAATQATRANDIAMHDRKLEVLEAVDSFRSELALCGEEFAVAVFNRFQIASEKASLYFPVALATQVEQFAKAAYELNIRRDHVKRLEGANLSVPLDKREAVFSQVDQCRAIAKELVPRLAAHVRLVK